MDKYIEAFKNAFFGTIDWTWKSIIFDVTWYTNYFWGLIIISLAVWILEIIFPWRKNQSIFRKDFWLDAFYMFFNFFLLNLIVLIALSNSAAQLFNDFLGLVGLSISNFQLLEINKLPFALRVFIFFIVIDFVQWWTHRLLHKFEFLWNFHKVHHSVKEMGFAAHLRYHWMENLVYKPLKTLVVMILIGGEPEQAFIVHFISVAIGHLNHANVKITWGPFKYLFNNSVMHLWHHVKALPNERRYGVNFGISLSLWDYIFKTNYIPNDSGDIEIGFENDDKFPIDNFVKQLYYPFGKED